MRPDSRANSGEWRGDADEAYWREQFRHERYLRPGFGYLDYAPAYRLGKRRYRPGIRFEQAESALAAEWPLCRGRSRLAWNEAREAVRASWNRMERFHRWEEMYA